MQKRIKKQRKREGRKEESKQQAADREREKREERREQEKRPPPLQRASFAKGYYKGQLLLQLSCAGVDNPWTTAQEGFY